MARIDDLRASVKARHRAAGKKVSRIDTSGTLINGSQYDPRVNAKDIDGMNTRQLRAYLGKLDKFMSRKTQFVPDSHRRPLPVQEWRKFKEVEAKANKTIKAVYEQYKNIVVEPKGNMTVDDLMRIMTPDRPFMADMANDAPYKGRNKSSRSINGLAALKRVMKETEKIYKNKTYFDKKLKQAKDVYLEMHKVVLDDELLTLVKGLSSKQFSLLWNYTNFAHAVSGAYAAAKLGLTRDSDGNEWYDQQFGDETREAKRLAQWAKTVKF